MWFGVLKQQYSSYIVRTFILYRITCRHNWTTDIRKTLSYSTRNGDDCHQWNIAVATISRSGDSSVLPSDISCSVGEL
jgi:hypothetical protein